MPVYAMRAITTFAVMATLIAAGCGGSGDSDTAASTTNTQPASTRIDGVLALGHLAPLTGPLAVLSPSLTVPVQMAVAEINAAGGVGGAPVTLFVADDGSVPETGRTALKKLVATDHVDAVIGPASSNVALELLSDVKSAPVLQCSGSNTAASLSDTDSGGFYFRTSPSDNLQAVALASLLLHDRRASPAFIVRNDTYGVGLARAATRVLREAGISPKPTVSYDPEGTDFTQDVEKIAASKPDSVVVLGLQEDGARILNGMIAAGIGPSGMPIYGTDGIGSSAFAAIVDSANPGVVAGVRGTTPASTPAGIDHPFNVAIATSGVDNIYSSYYYDCAILTALAAVRAKSDDPVKMQRAFAKNLTGNTLCKTFAECKSALESGKAIHYQGASSDFKVWDGHEPGVGRYDIWWYDSAGRLTTAPPSEQITVP